MLLAPTSTVLSTNTHVKFHTYAVHEARVLCNRGGGCARRLPHGEMCEVVDRPRQLLDRNSLDGGVMAVSDGRTDGRVDARMVKPRIHYGYMVGYMG